MVLQGTKKKVTVASASLQNHLASQFGHRGGRQSSESHAGLTLTKKHFDRRHLRAAIGAEDAKLAGRLALVRLKVGSRFDVSIFGAYLPPSSTKDAAATFTAILGWIDRQIKMLPKRTTVLL